MGDTPGSFDNRVLGAILRHSMIAPGDRVLVAVSGGQDSLALLHCLHRLGASLGIFLQAAHLNHGMRGDEAEADVAFLQEFCRELQVPLAVETADVPRLACEGGVSVEEAGREARREFLHRLAAETDCRRIALGHTLTDRAETVLMNILRGAGLDGLRGIRPVSGRTIRPLILVTRQDTADYCSDHGLEPRLDRTNLDTEAYLRNRIRLRLMPLLARDYAPGVEQALARLAEAAEGELEWTRETVQAAFDAARMPVDDGLALSLEHLASMPDGLLQRVLRCALETLRGDLQGFSMAHLDALADLVSGGRTGAQCSLPFDVWAERGYNRLVFCFHRPPQVAPVPGVLGLLVPGCLEWPAGGRLEASVEPPPCDFSAVERTEAYLNLEVAGSGLQVRSWRGGDRIAPLGMDGTRKLQDLFTDARVPRRERMGIPVVLNGGGTIVWVAGLCLSRLAAVEPGAQFSVRIKWKRAGDAPSSAGMTQ